MKLTKDDKMMLAKQYRRAWGEDGKMVDHCVKSASGYINFGRYLFVMDKPHIQTDFWFGEHTYDYDEVCERCDKARTDEDRFRRENMSGIEAVRIIEALDKGREAWICRKYGAFDDNSFVYVQFPDNCYNPLRGNQLRKLDDDERDMLRTFCEEEMEKFDKRLTTYLKRYGLSKCHFGVYWADR